jgi:hypothetical protein
MTIHSREPRTTLRIVTVLKPGLANDSGGLVEVVGYVSRGGADEVGETMGAVVVGVTSSSGGAPDEQEAKTTAAQISHRLRSNDMIEAPLTCRRELAIGVDERRVN